MEKFKVYEAKNNELKCAKGWVSNKDKIDSQDHSHYSLSNIVFSADYCGQSRAGANNYHHSPEVFNVYMAKVLKKRFLELSSEAISLMEEDVKKALLESEIELKNIQEKLELARSEK